MKSWAVVSNDQVVTGFDGTVEFVESMDRPIWWPEDSEILDITGIEPRPVIGFYRSGNEWFDGNPRMGTDRQTIPADGVTAAKITFTQKGPNAPKTVVFSVNGQNMDEVLSSEGLAVCEVVSSNSGDIIMVSAEGISVPIRVEL